VIRQNKIISTADILSEIESCILNEDFSIALEKLFSIRKSIVGWTNKEDKSRYFYLHATVLYETGDYRKANIKALVADRIIRRSSSHLLYADIRMLLGKISVRMGDFLGVCRRTSTY